jgi:hypothetical protein
MADGPSNIEERRAQAYKAGLQAATSFMQKVTTPTDPAHDRCLAQFRDEYGGSEAAVEKSYTDLAMSNFPRPEYHDVSYEGRVLSQHKISSHVDSSFMKLFQDLMKNKWLAVGYSGDAEVVKEFWNKYPLSSMHVGSYDGASTRR